MSIIFPALGWDLNIFFTGDIKCFHSILLVFALCILEWWIHVLSPVTMWCRKVSHSSWAQKAVTDVQTTIPMLICELFQNPSYTDFTEEKSVMDDF
jgi:hypothetical protein